MIKALLITVGLQAADMEPADPDKTPAKLIEYHRWAEAAADRGDLEFLQTLVTQNLVSVNGNGKDRKPLIFSAHNKEIAQYLISKNADVCARDRTWDLIEFVKQCKHDSALIPFYEKKIQAALLGTEDKDDQKESS